MQNQQLNQFSNIYFNKIKKDIKINENKAIIIVCGEPKSVFLEILFKALKKHLYNSPIILITSLKLLKNQMKNLNLKEK